MTGPQHYADAQRILELLRNQTAGELELDTAIRVAQVQATLALAAATAAQWAAPDSHEVPAYAAEWREVIR